jgi:hypothetical protein
MKNAIHLVTVAPAPVVSYADKANQVYQASASNFLDLDTRLTTSFQKPEDKTKLKNAVNKLRGLLTSYQITCWADWKFVESQTVTLDKILIDTTIQRELKIKWVLEILESFRAIEINPIRVYADKDKPGFWSCWDGQHTAIVLYVLAKYVMNLDPATVEIPVNIYKTDQKPEMRQSFISQNGGSGNLDMDEVELHRQYVLAYRVDNSAKYADSHRIQSALEQNKLFVCAPESHEKFQPGAISNCGPELLNPKYKVQHKESFCTLMNALGCNNRPVDAKETWIWIWYFSWCEMNNITVDQQYLDDLSDCLNDIYQDDYRANRLVDRAKHSYEEWLKKNNIYGTGTLIGTQWRQDNRKYGTLAYLIEMLKTHGNFPVPNAQRSFWTIDPSDLTLSFIRQQ